MNVQKLYKMAAGSGVLGAVLLALSMTTHPMDSAASTQWALSHTMGFVGTVLLLTAAVGLYLFTAERTGIVGLAGLVMLLFSMALFSGLVYFDGLVAPAAGVDAMAFFNRQFQEGGPVGIVLGATAALWIGGWLLLGLASYRADALPRWALITVVLAAIPISGVPVPMPAKLAGAAVFTAGMTGLGYALWRHAGRETAGSSPSGGVGAIEARSPASVQGQG